ALGVRRVARGAGGGERLDGVTQLGQRAQLGVAAGALEAPPDDARVEHVPVLDAEHDDAHAPLGAHEAEALEEPHHLPRDRARDAELGPDRLQGQRGSGGGVSAGDATTEGVEHGGVQDRRRHASQPSGGEWCYQSLAKGVTNTPQWRPAATTTVVAREHRGAVAVRGPEAPPDTEVDTWTRTSAPPTSPTALISARPSTSSSWASRARARPPSRRSSHATSAPSTPRPTSSTPRRTSTR